MKNLRLLPSSLVLVFIILFSSCFSSQTKKVGLNNDLNWIVNNYINFYSKKSKDFDAKKKYLMISISEDANKRQTDVYITDNCYECPGVEVNDYLIFLYKGFKVVIATDNSKSAEIVLKKFKNIYPSEKFKVKPYNDNVMYHTPREWKVIIQ